MATPEMKPVKAKKDFTAYLSAVNTDRLMPANSTDKPLLLTQRIDGVRDMRNNANLLQAAGLLVSVMWLIGAAWYVQRAVGWNNVSRLMPHELGGFLAGVLSPIALFWMVAAFLLRSNDVKIYAETLREEIQRMIFPSAEADRRINNDIERLMRQTAAMSHATKIAMQTLREARDAMQAQIAELNGQSELAAERLDRAGLVLETRAKTVADAQRGLTTSIEAMTQHAAGVDTLVQHLQTANGEIKQQSELVREADAVLQNAVNQLQQQRDGLRVEADTVGDKVAAAGRVLQTATDNLYATTDDALDKAKLVETRLHGQVDSVQATLHLASMAVTAIDAQSQAAADRLQHAADHSAMVAQRVEDVLHNAIARLQDVGRWQETAQTRAVEQLAGLDDTAQRLHAVSDTTLAAVHGALDELRVLADAQTDLHDQMARNRDTWHGQLAQTDAVIGSTQAIAETGRQLRDVLGQIGHTADWANERAMAAQSGIAIQAGQLHDAAGRVQAAADDVQARHALIARHLVEVQVALAQVETQSATAQQNAVNATARLLEQNDTLAMAQQRLQTQQRECDAAGDETLQRLQQAMTIMARETAALEQTANRAQSQTEALAAQDGKRKREAFFQSAKFVVESLHSLALDFTRLLDGELPDKTWKAYQKGEVGSFTKRLLTARDEAAQEKMRNLYRDDVEFRTYAQRYLRQFEEMYDAAQNNDHADLLTSVFLSSDVGKLYEFLGRLLGRDVRGQGKIG